MIQGIVHTALVVRDYEEAKEFYCGKLGFEVVADTQLSKKRWVRIKAPGGQGSEILLSKAVDETQASVIGRQAGGRVLFFMHTNDFEADYQRMISLGVEFTYGNRIDLIQPAEK